MLTQGYEEAVALFAEVKGLRALADIRCRLVARAR